MSTGIAGNPTPPFHGGRLHHAAERFEIPLENWLDLSTGINPHSYPLPAVPHSVWQRLPDDDDSLLSIAAGYYGSAQLLAVAGSQMAIESLPRLRPSCRVGILSPAYAEYAYQWTRQGHAVEALTADEIEVQLAERMLDVVVVIRPNNPTAEFIPQSRLNRWLTMLQQNSGWLIIDEAFIDPLPGAEQLSMITKKPLYGLIVLRSVGKFFGLAGIRLGFVWAEQRLLDKLSEQQETWSVSGVARWAGAIALQDINWQSKMRRVLGMEVQRLKALLQEQGFSSQSTPLFCTVDLREHQQGLATDLYLQLAKQGVLVRNFEDYQALRFGLPADAAGWQQLASALSELKR